MGLDWRLIEPFLNAVPLASIIILDHHGQRFWPSLLESLSAQTVRDFEMLVVDNGGDLRLKHKSLDIKLLRESRGSNLGFAGGVNLAWREARGAFVAFLNNDTVVGPEWLEALLARVDSSPDVGAACSRILFLDRWAEVHLESDSFVPDEFEESEDCRRLGLRLDFGLGAYQGFGSFLVDGCHGVETDGIQSWVWTNGSGRLWVPLDEQGRVELLVSSHKLLEGRRFRVRCGERNLSVCVGSESTAIRFEPPPAAIFDVVNSAGSELKSDWSVVERGIYQKDGADFAKSIDLEVGSACSMVVRKSALEGQLPFDAEFFAYSEDTDLCLRLRENGYRIVYEPKSVVRHHRSGTAGTQSAFQVFHATRNRFWVIAKHAPWRVVWNTVSKELWELERYAPWLDETFSLARLKREARWGVVKRLWRRLCDSD